jgi:hypothetical protein
MAGQVVDETFGNVNRSTGSPKACFGNGVIAAIIALSKTETRDASYFISAHKR